VTLIGDTVVSDGLEEIRAKALKHVGAKVIIMLHTKRDHAQHHPGVHEEKSQQERLHHFAQVDDDCTEDCSQESVVGAHHRTAKQEK
jgi:hypothetical protein